MRVALGSARHGRTSLCTPARVCAGLVCALALAALLSPAFADQHVAGDSAERTTATHQEIEPLGVGCPVMIPGGNVYIDFHGTASGCSELEGICVTGEGVAFRAAAFGYSFTCMPHTFLWTFGDGSTDSGGAVSHVFASANTYTVKVTISSGIQTVVLGQNVLVTNRAPARRRAIVPRAARGTEFPRAIGASGGATALSPIEAARRESSVPGAEVCARTIDSEVAMRTTAEILSRLDAGAALIGIEGYGPDADLALETFATMFETR